MDLDYGETYLVKLRTQQGAVANKMLAGFWLKWNLLFSILSVVW